MFEKLSFTHLLGAVLAAFLHRRFRGVCAVGRNHEQRNDRRHPAESATIMAAEKTSCSRFGTYASIATLRREGLLTFKPVYNSVVFMPGKHCGTIVVGSPAYQSPAG